MIYRKAVLKNLIRGRSIAYYGPSDGMEGGNSLKKILFIATLSLLTVLAFGFDIGGNIEDSTYLSYTDDSTFFHSDTLPAVLLALLEPLLDFSNNIYS